MDLITLYNYQHMNKSKIKAESFNKMIEQGSWEFDARGTKTVKILRKQFALKDGSLYKVLLRFSLMNVYEDLYDLDQPTPFVVIQSQELENGMGVKDVNTFHGRKVKNILGYMNAGVPAELFDLISSIH